VEFLKGPLIVTETDKWLWHRHSPHTSISETAWCAEGTAMLEKLKASVVALDVRLDTAMNSGSSAQIAELEIKLVAATADMNHLRRRIEAAERNIPVLQAAELAATETLRIKKDDANRKCAACLALFREKYTAAVATMVELLLVERDAIATRADFFQAHLRAPEVARKAVSTDLLPFGMFPPGLGVSSLHECVSKLPALADTDSPDVRADWRLHWPPMPPAPPKAPPAPVREPVPYVRRGLTVEFTVRHPPGPFEPDEDDLMPFRAAPAAD
jgi:hypothetical protein